MARQKKATTEEIVETEVLEEVVVKKPASKKVEKVYNDHDEIQCRSNTMGQLLLGGKKTKNDYSFMNFGDTYGVEVCDLNAWLATKSAILFDPLLIIDDEEFLAQPKWKPIKELYEKAMHDDIEAVLELPNSQFVSALQQLPKGYVEVLKTIVRESIENETFDSIQKVKAIDNVCGTEFYSLLK